jgi:hypothetical protein
MIREAELRRHAVAAGVDTMIQDLDYGLGWFLAYSDAKSNRQSSTQAATCPSPRSRPNRLPTASPKWRLRRCWAKKRPLF